MSSHEKKGLERASFGGKIRKRERRNLV